MCPTDENAIRRFRSFCARHARAAYTMPITASNPIHGAYFCAPYGRMGSAIRMNPYVPIFSMTPARSTDPIVGASVWASGSHVWNGHIGTFTAKPSATAPKATS